MLWQLIMAANNQNPKSLCPAHSSYFATVLGSSASADEASDAAEQPALDAWGQPFEQPTANTLPLSASDSWGTSEAWGPTQNNAAPVPPASAVPGGLGSTQDGVAPIVSAGLVTLKRPTDINSILENAAIIPSQQSDQKPQKREKKYASTYYPC
jgi:hypothetical protein